MSTNEIKKQIFLKSTKSRVWKAITDSQEFGIWFGMNLDGPFIAGQKITGSIVPTKVDEKIAASQKPYEGTAVQFLVDRIEPEELFSLKWHPSAADANTDYSKEPMTTVTFTLNETEGGVLLTVTESGFEQIPISRRLEALKSNEGGWEAQMGLIQKYLEVYAKSF